MIKFLAVFAAIAILTVYSNPVRNNSSDVSTTVIPSSDHSTAIKSDLNIRHPLTTITVPPLIASTENLGELDDLDDFEGRIDRIEFKKWWKKVKHALEKIGKKIIKDLLDDVINKA